MSDKTVLVVDDEEIICDLLAKTLGKLGYGVIVAESGQQAVALFEKNHGTIDLAIIDLFLPGMDGRETMTRLKALDPTLVVLLSSGQDRAGTASLSASAGADGFLLKPYRVGQLAEAVKRALENRVVSPDR